MHAFVMSVTVFSCVSIFHHCFDLFSCKAASLFTINLLRFNRLTVISSKLRGICKRSYSALAYGTAETYVTKLSTLLEAARSRVRLLISIVFIIASIVISSSSSSSIAGSRCDSNTGVVF